MKGCFSNIMGANASVTLMNEEKGLDLSPPDARYFGLHNFGNTCYCNSVLQALFFCLPFREQVLQYRQQHNGKQAGGKKDSLLGCLCDLFNCIICQKRKAGVMQPKKFVARLRKENESFDNFMQHDAHEFFNHLLNSIHVVLLEEKKAERERKRLLEQTSANGTGFKKERSSFFHKSKKTKSLKSKHVTDTHAKSYQEASPALTDNSSSAVPLSEGAASLDFPPTADEDPLSLLQSSKKAASEPKLTNGKAPSDSASNVGNSPKSKSFSLFSRIRQSKKVSTTSKSSDCIDNAKIPSTPNIKEEEDTSTWIYDIFQGTYTTITRCLNCETVKNRDEDFLDLSVDIEQNTSITHCLRVFSHQQTLGGEHKYFCEVCQSKQEAEIEMRLKKLPTILVLHLKRFKYCDTLNKYTKLSYRVVFPFELRLFNTTEDARNDHRLYDLTGVVVHCGSTVINGQEFLARHQLTLLKLDRGPYRGHYISVVKSHGMWMLFDDDTVERMQPNSMEDFYGVTTDKNSESGYILFYQSRE